MLKEKQRTEGEGEGNFCRSWMAHVTNTKERMVSFSGLLLASMCLMAQQWPSCQGHSFLWLGAVLDWKHFFINISWIFCVLSICSLTDERRHKVEPAWSIDPALTLSMYDSEWRADEVQSWHLDIFIWVDWVVKSLMCNCSVPFSRRKNNSVMENWQIQTAPGSVTAYCTPLTEGAASLVNINFQKDLLYWHVLIEIINTSWSVVSAGINNLDYCKLREMCWEE